MAFTVVADLTISTGTLPARGRGRRHLHHHHRDRHRRGPAGGSTVVVTTAVQVSGTLLTNCQPLTGAGSFTLAAGATLGICDAAGISASGSTGAVQTTGTRSFSTDATYVYNGTAAQVTGNGLPATVRSLTREQRRRR